MKAIGTITVAEERTYIAPSVGKGGSPPDNATPEGFRVKRGMDDKEIAHGRRGTAAATRKANKVQLAKRRNVALGSVSAKLPPKRNSGYSGQRPGI